MIEVTFKNRTGTLVKLGADVNGLAPVINAMTRDKWRVERIDESDVQMEAPVEQPKRTTKKKTTTTD